MGGRSCATNWVNYLKQDLAFTGKWTYDSFIDDSSLGQLSVISNTHSRLAVTIRGLQEFFAVYTLSDLVCFDNFGKSWRFGLIYVFNSYADIGPRKQYVCFTAEGVPIGTSSDIIASAEWAEREA